MYWTPYASTVEFRPGASRALAAWLALGHCLAAIALAVAGVPWPGPLAALALLTVSIRRAMKPLGPGVSSITWSPLHGWCRRTARDQYIPMELTGSSVVTNAALFLHWRDQQGPWRALLPRDCLGETAYRRMRVLARFHDAGRTHC